MTKYCIYDKNDLRLYLYLLNDSSSSTIIGLNIICSIITVFENLK